MRCWMGGTATGAATFFSTLRLSAGLYLVNGSRGAPNPLLRGRGLLLLRALRGLALLLGPRGWLELFGRDVIGRHEELGRDGLAVHLLAGLLRLQLRDLKVRDRDDALVGGHLRKELADVVVVARDLDRDGLARVEVLLDFVLGRELAQRQAAPRAILDVLQDHRQLALLGQQRLEVFVVGLGALVTGLELVEALRGNDRAGVGARELFDLRLDVARLGARPRGDEVPEGTVDEERGPAEDGEVHVPGFLLEGIEFEHRSFPSGLALNIPLTAGAATSSRPSSAPAGSAAKRSGRTCTSA